MSQWTHVNGNIRIDYIRLSEEDSLIGKIKEIFGKEILWGDGEKAWDEGTKLPCGSEGSLEYKIYESPDPCHIAAYSVNVFGDLRNYGNNDINLIEQWFANIVKVFNIRDAVITINDGWSDKLIILCVVYARNEIGQRIERTEINKSGGSCDREETV